MSSVLDDINKKRKTLLKDVKGEPIGVIRTGYNENRDLARKYGEETFYKPGKTYLISTKGGDTAKGWKADMAENREERDKLFKKSGSDVAVYGVKVAEDDRRLPESVAYLDGTMPKKVAKSTTAQAQTAAVPAATKEGAPAAKAETTEQRPAITAQPATKAPAQTKSTAAVKEETPAAPDTQASDDVVALEEVDVFGNRSQKKEPETTFPKNAQIPICGKSKLI